MSRFINKFKLKIMEDPEVAEQENAEGNEEEKQEPTYEEV
mgnify:FL=1